VIALPPAALVRAFIIVSVRAYRESLARALSWAGIEVVGAASDSVSALPCIGELEPDVVLLEALRPEQRWSVAGLKAATPETLVVAFGVPDTPADAVALVEAGASGYVTRDQSVEEAALVLRSVARGELPCSGRVAAILAGRVAELSAAGPAVEPSPSGLTTRELEIAGLIGAGLSNKEIASMLYIELATVKNHVHNILAKLRVSRRSEVASKVPSSLPLWEADSARLTHQAPGSQRI
jgi:two-component system nitrate/nitrite response regulator NarL